MDSRCIMRHPVLFCRPFMCQDALAGCQPACISYQNFAPPLGQPPAGLFPVLYPSMPLLIRPNPLSPNQHQVMHGKWQIGQINPALTGGARWIWALNGVPGGTSTGMRLAGIAATLDEAEAALRERWEQWLAWAGLSDVKEQF